MNVLTAAQCRKIKNQAAVDTDNWADSLSDEPTQDDVDSFYICAILASVASLVPAPAVVQAEVSDKLATALALLNELSLLWHDDHKIATLNSRQYPTTTMEFDEVMEKIEEFTLPERLK